jgi:hypothetical protein
MNGLVTFDRPGVGVLHVTEYPALSRRRRHRCCNYVDSSNAPPQVNMRPLNPMFEPTIEARVCAHDRLGLPAYVLIINSLHARSRFVPHV